MTPRSACALLVTMFAVGCASNDGDGDLGSSSDAIHRAKLASPGCAKRPKLGDLMATRVNVAGQGERTYQLHVPSGVTQGVAEKLVFVWHGCGGSVDNIRSTLTVEASATAAHDSAIFVYPQVTTSTNPATVDSCFVWGNELPYFDQIVTDVENEYCIDTHHIFSTGYSSGGIITDYLGCDHSDVVRAIAPAEGGLPSSTRHCPGKVDALVIHNPADEQIGWDVGTTATPGSWTGGRGELPFGHFYANDGCTSPTFSPTSTKLGEVAYRCAESAEGGERYRLTLWLHNAHISGGTDLPNHWFPASAPAQIWSFFAATP